MPESMTPPETDKVDATNVEFNAEIAKDLKSHAEACRRVRKSLLHDWKRNVDLRIGKAVPFSGGGATEDEVQSEINPDWALTKTKTANLYSQVPAVQLTHENKQYAAAVGPFSKALNYELGEKRANIGVPMEEVLNDVVNAAGVGAIVVGYAVRSETVDMPVEEIFQSTAGPIPTKDIPPEQLKQLVQAGLLHMQPIENTLDSKIFGHRISPADLLWPSEFIGSNFDDGDWIGYDHRCSWAEAKNEFKLKDEDKDRITSGTEISSQSDLRSEPETTGTSDAKKVKYSTMYYWRYKVDPDEKSFKAIWKLVYVEGMEKPVIHEAWKGQKYDEQTRTYIGSHKFPVRVLTLTYITDNPIPPSDSAAGRPQVNDMRRSRSQMFMQRERSMPIRWADSNRIDTEILANLQRGVFQGFIPTNGDGSRSIGEVARASYPSEDLTFDQQTKTDLMESWQIGPNQLGTTQAGRRTAGEANITQQNFATRIGQERGRVASFFLGVVEIIAGYMALYSDFPSLSEEERQAMQQAWNSKQILHDLVFKIRPDSAIMLDTQSRIDRIQNFINISAKSGYVNVEPLIREMAELSGIDPTDVLIKPEPPKPELPNISYRFSSKDDLINPLVMALLVKSGQAPSQDELEAAKKILEAGAVPPAPPPMPAPEGGGNPPLGQPAGPEGAPGALPPAPGAPPGPVPGQDMAPDWSLANKVAKRSRDISGGD